jgi:hypothetical protein
VVFRVAGRPFRLPVNCGHDADFYAESWDANKRMDELRLNPAARPQLWARDAGRWQRIA